MVKMVVGLVLLVLLALLMVLGVGLLLLFAIGFVLVFLHHRQLLRTLANCPCPHCDSILGMQTAKRAYREWDKAPDGVQWTRCDRSSALEPDGEGLDVIIHVQRDPNWRVSCNRCGQLSLFDTEDLLVYHSRHIGNEKLYAIADVMSGKDIEGALAPERLDAICRASGCERIDVLLVTNKLRQSARNSNAMGRIS